MYCSKCGKEIDDSAVICVHCGVPVAGRYAQTVQPAETAQTQPAVKSVLSLVGFIISMIGVIFGMFLPLPAVGMALSIAGYCCSRSKKQSDGLGLAGIIVGAVMLVFWIIIWVLIASDSYYYY